LLASIPSSFNAPLASPVPLAASANLLVNLCVAISTVLISTPDISAAYLNAPNSLVVTPNLLAVFPKVSMLCKDDLINKPNPPIPANPTNPVLRLNTALPIPLKPLVTLLKAFLVASRAVILILVGSAIFYHLKICMPFIYF
jgi:hypothetical protein